MPKMNMGSFPSSPSRETSTRLNDLKLWLRSLIHQPDFFTTHPPHSLSDLHYALHLAITEITNHLDPQLEAVADSAQSVEHNIQLKAGDFDQDRKLDVDELREQGLAGIKLLSRQTVVIFLVLARDEIEWLDNETRRLEVHCENAKELKRASLRSSFEYQPMPRKVRGPADWDIADTDKDDNVKKRKVKSEDSDEEMLERGDENQSMRRDSVAAGSWGGLKIESPV